MKFEEPKLTIEQIVGWIEGLMDELNSALKILLEDLAEMRVQKNDR